MEQTARQPHEWVADEVRAALARRRISGRQAAREIGWNPNYIARRLDGRTAFDVNDLAALAALLDMPVTTFFIGLTERVTKDPLSTRDLLNPVLTCVTLAEGSSDTYLPASRAA